MKILHYSLGFPPYRTGGLTKFCMDLMIQQCHMGNQVALMWPGRIGILNGNTRIRLSRTVNADDIQIIGYEIINPLPISFDEGISNIKAFTQEGNLELYKEFLKQLQPDVIHIHTLMGLHKSFIIAAKEIGIRLVFTAHDFFPICPKVTMFRKKKICDSISDCSECGDCNVTALSMKKIIFLQSLLYRMIKDTKVIKYLRKCHRDEYLSEKNKESVGLKPVGAARDYLFLRNHYQSMLQIVDKIHYNSTVTKKVYEDRLTLPEGIVIPISHLDIADHRVKKDFSSEELKIRYLGPAGTAKGFFLLKEALDRLLEKRRDFRLDVHFSLSEVPSYIREHEKYEHKDLNEIFEDTDILVAPSILNETFGFTVLEALSYGVPVIISDTVGAKDVIADGAGIIIENINAEKLCETIENLTIGKLQQMNQAILNKQVIPKMEDMCVLLEKECYS